MSYDIFIDVRHGNKHSVDDQRESWCTRYGHDPADETEELTAVVNALRDMADEIDPRVMCDHCGASRGEHAREGGLYRCFNRTGPITQHKWWRAPSEIETAP